MSDRTGIIIDGFSPTMLVSTTDHTKLLNRDAAEQHPISAIAELQPKLDTVDEEINILANKSVPVSNSDILDIFNS